MISQTALSQSEAQTAVALWANRRMKDARLWHALKASLVPQLLDVNPNHGLPASEVTTRRLLYGPNKSEIPGSHRMTGMLALLFLSIVGFLVTAAILNAATRDNTEAFAILVVVVLGTIFGFAHMLRAARAFDAMQYATQATVRVRREGQGIKIKAEGLVPGDIVILTPGDIVPADARLIEIVQLRAKESVLTGKRTAVDKRVSQVVTDAPIAKRQSIVYSALRLTSAVPWRLSSLRAFRLNLGKGWLVTINHFHTV